MLYTVIRFLKMFLGNGLFLENLRRKIAAKNITIS
jgi:hypothetical protein